MSNRAQLPCGIENIRPHLDTMDNVPLLVSLFTDSSPGRYATVLFLSLWFRILDYWSDQKYNLNPGLRIRIRIRSDLNLFSRIRSRIRKIFTGSVLGSGSYRYFGYVKLNKQGKNILKIQLIHIFR